MSLRLLPFSQAKSISMNPLAQVHLPCPHIPELSLPVHCSSKLQNPPTGTVSEKINDNKSWIEKNTEKESRNKKISRFKSEHNLLITKLFTKFWSRFLDIYINTIGMCRSFHLFAFMVIPFYIILWYRKMYIRFLHHLSIVLTKLLQINII